MKRVPRAVLLLAAAALAGAGLWHWLGRPVLVEVAPVVRGPAVQAVYATGTVEPVRWAAVAPAVRGRLLELFVDDGDRVAQGQLLATLDSTVAAAQVAEVEARARFAAEEAERLARLAQRGAAARSELDRAESEARAFEAGAEAARRRLADFAVRAPIDGMVLRRDGEPGEMVDTGDTVFWIGEATPLRLTAEVDEEDVPSVAPGQRALLKADAFPERVFEGTLEQITPKGDPVQKTYRVRIALPEDTPLMIGMTIEANIVVRETNDALLVPSSALRSGELFVVEDGTARRRAVVPGVRGARVTEILDGVEEGEPVVAAPPEALADGARVRIAPAGGS
ncbi:efflux RND transporter periplasmic adaptor subunit [Geminicoccaceae bacterium 1502E]|nr:efflux RND transporter periplasmic adaptor subunit [Geminicoccaceae bacterium 1502E]